MARPQLPENERRKRRDVWLSDDELAEVTERARAAGLPVRQFIREAALSSRIIAAPPVANTKAWRDLAPVAANLNQLTRHANTTGELAADLPQVLEHLARQVDELRAVLIGIRPGDEDDDR